MFIFLFLHMDTQTHIYIHKQTHIYTHIHVNTYIYTYIFKHIYNFTIRQQIVKFSARFYYIIIYI